MSLRTVNPYTSYQVLLDLQRTKERMSNLSEQIASGSRLNRLSDDPTASALVLNFENSIEQNKAYIQQADSAASFLQTTETVLQSVNDVVTRLLELGARGLGTGITASGRQAIVPEVTGIKTNLVALANTQSQGKYLFAGARTTTVPFASTATGATYAGDHSDISLDVSVSTTVKTNLPGDTVFFNGDASAAPTATTGQGSSGDVFAQVSNLIDGLNTNNTAAIQTAFDNLKTILGNVNAHLAEMGGRQASLQQLTDNVQSYNLSLQTIQSSYQDLDYPTAIMDYTNAQTSQQASLSVLGKSNNLNLFNYLA
jgi:flagellar hook-associated protein 3 FlgL